MKLQTTSILLFLLLPTCILSAAAHHHNITNLLSKHAAFSNFNRFLSLTNIATDINERQSLTILAPDNSLLQSLEDNNLPVQELADILRHHVLLQYIAEGQFDDMSNIDSLASAMGAEKMGYRAGSIVRKLVEIPESIRVFQINRMLLPSRAKAAAATPSPSPSPAPAPAPLPVNITATIKSAGLFNTFLNLLLVTGVGELFQTQANNSETGITIFCPTDKAFAALPAGTLNNLTAQEKIDLVKSQALSTFYPLASLQKFADPVAPTFATGSHGAGSYTVNITNEAGSVVISTASVRSPIISTLYNTDPVAIFAISKVLLPVEIFGIPAPSPSPSPSPFLPPEVSPSPSSAHKPVKTKTIAPTGAQSNRASSQPLGSVLLSMTMILAGLLYLV